MLRALIDAARFLAGVFTVAAVLAVGTATVSVQAQSNLTGSIAGQVAKGSLVTVQEVDTGFLRTATSGTDGNYRISALPPGRYKVTYTDADGQAKEVEASVNVGSATIVGGKGDVLQLENFVVDASTINPIDYQQTEKITLLTNKQMDILPIGRDLTSIALQASGTTVGDIGFAEAFRTLPSFGGSSVSENATYVNGFNISNFRNGLYGSEVPFDFLDQYEVKTGGYSAEFGRSTGGVITTTTKRGTNKYKAGVSVEWVPDAGRQNSPSSWFTNNQGVRTPKVFNDEDKFETLVTNIYASGPIWKNKLFFYGLYSLRDYSREDVVSSGTRHLTRTSDDPFWGGKIDFTPFKGQHFQYTVFKDKSRLIEEERDYDLNTRTVDRSADPSLVFADRGGTNHIVNYSGTFFEKLQVSALWGRMQLNKTDSGSEDALPVIYDRRSGVSIYVQGNPNGIISTAADERVAKRLDLTFPFELFGNHTLRAGYDNEDNISSDLSQYSGNLSLRYQEVPGNGIVNGAAVPSGTTAVVRHRVYNSGGSFKVNSQALYLEDTWSLMNDRLNLRFGIRNETFENLNSLDLPFIKVKDQRAPRLGLTYDLFGDKKTKVALNFGRYHLPIASNTNVRLAGGENFIEKYFVLTSVDSDGKNPVLGPQLGVTNTYSDGTIRDRREIVDMDIKPMYQDEWMATIQHTLSPTTSIGATFITRNLDGTAMDDMIVDHALTEWANANGFTGFDATGEHAFVLANPGRPIRMFWDFDGSGTLDANEEALLTPEMLNYPTATRKYHSLELFYEKTFDKKWFANLSYTWSQSYGNYEGWVLSDNDQDDAGITILFDSPMVTENTYGYLPNDRRHQFKALGYYQINPEWGVGATALLASGRPINRIGFRDDPVRGAGSNEYLLIPRGTGGRTPWVLNLDLALVYRPTWAKNRLTMRLDVRNVLNGKSKTEIEEIYEDSIGNSEPSYGTVKAWQPSRRISLSMRYEY